jgi:hypothetical protein
VNKVVQQPHTKKLHLVLRIEPGLTTDTVMTEDDPWFKRHV